MSQVTSVILAAVLLTSTSCTPNLVDRFDPEDIRVRPPVKAMLTAPIIVVGKVSAVKRVGGLRHAARMPGVKIELLDITISVENVLRGQISKPELSFCYYMFSAQNDKVYGIPIYTPVLNERLVLFLTEDKGVLRSVRDIVDCTIRIRSGTHEGLTPPTGSDLGKTISWIVMTPGKDADPELFAKGLDQAFAIAEAFSGEPYALTLLRRLSESTTSTALRAAADELTVAVTAK